MRLVEFAALPDLPPIDSSVVLTDRHIRLALVRRLLGEAELPPSVQTELEAVERIDLRSLACQALAHGDVELAADLLVSGNTPPAADVVTRHIAILTGDADLLKLFPDLHWTHMRITGGPDFEMPDSCLCQFVDALLTHKTPPPGVAASPLLTAAARHYATLLESGFSTSLRTRICHVPHGRVSSLLEEQSLLERLVLVGDKIATVNQDGPPHDVEGYLRLEVYDTSGGWTVFYSPGRVDAVAVHYKRSPDPRREAYVAAISHTVHAVTADAAELALRSPPDKGTWEGRLRSQS